MKTVNDYLRFRVSRVYFCLITILVASIGSASALDFGADENSLPSVIPSHTNIEVVDRRVSLKCNDASIRDVLNELADKMRFVVVGGDTLQGRISIEFNKLSLTEALKRILSGQDYLFHQARFNESNNIVIRDASSETLRIISDETIDITDEYSSEPDVATAVLEDLLISGDVSDRRRAVKIARKLDTNSALEPLTLALADPDAKVRVKAIYGLAEIDDDSAVAALTTSLGDESPNIRVEAAHALGRIGNDLAVAHLKYALYDLDPDVQESAVEALADAGGIRATEVLHEVLRSNKNSLRIQAIDALEEIGSQQAILALQEAALFKEEEVQQTAREALDRLGYTVN